MIPREQSAWHTSTQLQTFSSVFTSIMNTFQHCIDKQEHQDNLQWFTQSTHCKHWISRNLEKTFLIAFRWCQIFFCQIHDKYGLGYLAVYQTAEYAYEEVSWRCKYTPTKARKKVTSWLTDRNKILNCNGLRNVFSVAVCSQLISGTCITSCHIEIWVGQCNDVTSQVTDLPFAR